MKVVFLHYGNILSSVPMVYSTALKKYYVTFQHSLDRINYNANRWLICTDLKVIAILTGLQLGHTKYCCFLCLWDTKTHSEHYWKKNWSLKKDIELGQHSILLYH